jgi:hypothetical protein
MKAHVIIDPENDEPTLLRNVSNEDWEHLRDLGVHLEEISVVSEMSLETAVFALQQIALHLDGMDDADVPLRKLFSKTDDAESAEERLRGILSRIRILTTTTLVSLGILGDLETGEDGLPSPVELPSMGIEEQQATLRSLTAERQSE